MRRMGMFKMAAPSVWPASVEESGNNAGIKANRTHPSLNKRGRSRLGRDTTTIIASDDVTIPGTEVKVKIF